MVVKERHVAPVGAPHDVKDVARNRRQITMPSMAIFATMRTSRCVSAPAPGLVHDVERDQRGHEVTYTWNSPTSHPAQIGYWCLAPKGGVEQRRKFVDAREALLPGCGLAELVKRQAAMLMPGVRCLR